MNLEKVKIIEKGIKKREIKVASVKLKKIGKMMMTSHKVKNQKSIGKGKTQKSKNKMRKDEKNEEKKGN